MPRLDNSSADVIMHWGLDYDFDDPGGNSPMDFCADCWLDVVIMQDFDYLEVDHPTYKDDAYYCYECGDRLTEDDDTY